MPKVGGKTWASFLWGVLVGLLIGYALTHAAYEVPMAIEEEKIQWEKQGLGW